MPATLARRLTRSVELLEPRPGGRVLDIGGGNGVAAGLLCDRLGDGLVVAIDRSARAVDAAALRNAHHVAAGRLELRAVPLAGLDMPAASFDAACAVNVNLFWLDAGRELAVLRRVLRPGGRLVVVIEPPSPAQLPRIAGALRANLVAAGFRIDRLETDAGGPFAELVARSV